MIIKKEDENDSIKTAVEYLSSGKLISFKTDTVYALACDPFNDDAIKKIYKIKKRDIKKPISIFVKNLELAKKFLHFNNIEEKIAKNFLPGKITLVLNKKTSFVSPLLHFDNNKIGIRIPNTKFITSLLSKFPVIAATSVNTAGDPSAVNLQKIIEYFPNQINYVIDGGLCKNNEISTVIEVKNHSIEIIRHGSVKEEEISKII